MDAQGTEQEHIWLLRVSEMPRYYKEYGRGYDLNEELAFCEIDGTKYILGSAGSFILVCQKCGNERFREAITEGELRTKCFHCSSPMEPHTFDNLDRHRKLWGDTVIPISARKAERLKREAEIPHGWKFGDKTEADFPLGYAKEK